MMFKSFLLGALAICSLSANAQDEPKSYSFKVMDNYEKSDILVSAKVGSITPMQFYKNADEVTNCEIKLKNEFGSETLKTEFNSKEGVTAFVYPISEKDGVLNVVFAYELTKINEVDKGKTPVKIGDNCTFYNSTYKTENYRTQWSGDMKLNEPVKVKLSNDKDITILIEDAPKY